MHQSIPAAPNPPPRSPRATAGHLPALSVSGVGHLQFCAARGPGICQTRGFTQAFDTYAVPYQKITTQTILLEKQAYWLICQGQEKIEEGCKGMFSFLFFYFFFLKASISLKKFQQNEKASNFFFFKGTLPFQITTTNNKDIGIGIVQSFYQF